MSTTQEVSQDREAIAAVVAQHFDELSKTDGLDAGYKLAALSASGSIGPAGANTKGWATYLATQTGKIHFVSDKVTQHQGLWAGGGVAPAHNVLEPGALAGRKGTFRLWGSGRTGFLQMWVGGRPVFASPLVMIGVGIGAWTAEGEVSFHHYP
jgi:hypothetical protein